MTRTDEEQIKMNLESFVEIYNGTAIGQEIKNMMDNGSTLQSILDKLDANDYNLY